MREYKKSREWRNQRDGIRIAVTGSREAPPREAIRQALDTVLQTHGRELVIVHGGHTLGIDAIAAEWAREHNVRTAVYRPNFKGASRNIALARRNRQMVKDGLSSVLSFSPAKLAHSSDVVVQARKANIPVEVVRPGTTQTQRLASSTDSLAAYEADPTANRQRSQPEPVDTDAALESTHRTRPNTHFDQDETTKALKETVRILADRIAPDGYQLEDQREGLLWGFVNVFNEQTKRLDRAIANTARDPDIAPADKEAAREALQERKYAFEELHSAAGALYFDETRRVWDTKARDRLAPVTSTKLEFEAFVKNRERYPPRRAGARGRRHHRSRRQDRRQARTVPLRTAVEATRRDPRKARRGHRRTRRLQPGRRQACYHVGRKQRRHPATVPAEIRSLQELRQPGRAGRL